MSGDVTSPPTWFDWLTFVALFAGPSIAVLVTRWLDDRRVTAQRRMDLFKTLMRTRRSPTSPEHVGALNLIEFEFAGDDAVQAAWRTLFGHFAATHGRQPSEESSSTADQEEKARRDVAFDKRLMEERQKLLAKLLHAMARALRFKVEQLEIFEGGYLPQGWVDQDMQASIARQFFTDLSLGRKWVPVGVFDGNVKRPDVGTPAPAKKE